MNEACCTRPPIASDYEPAGTYSKLDDGTKLYTIGSDSAERAVVLLYDALGYCQPLLLGADILSKELNATVYVPDFFHGEPIDPNIFSMGEAERTAALNKWIGGPGDFGLGVKNTKNYTAELKSKQPSAKKWASLGYCWGGKILALSSGEGTPFDVTGAVHPGRIDPAEPPTFKIPHICLLSMEDGSPEEQKAYEKALKSNGQDVHYEVFGDQVHGWMAARADLKDEHIKSEYERGYNLVAGFFKKYL